jgi:predicted RNA-binding protein with PUA domain
MSDIVSELKKLKVQELRDRLAAKGLDTTGVKDILVARLAEAEAEQSDAGQAAAEVVDETVVQSEAEVEATEEVAVEAHDEAAVAAVETVAESAPVESSVDAEMQKRAERGLIVIVFF